MESGIQNGKAEPVSIAAILTASGYALDIFTPDEVASLEIVQKRGKPFLKCTATGKERSAKPEEIVRQLYLDFTYKELVAADYQM